MNSWAQLNPSSITWRLKSSNAKSWGVFYHQSSNQVQTPLEESCWKQSSHHINRRPSLYCISKHNLAYAHTLPLAGEEMTITKKFCQYHCHCILGWFSDYRIIDIVTGWDPAPISYLRLLWTDLYPLVSAFYNHSGFGCRMDCTSTFAYVTLEFCFPKHLPSLTGTPYIYRFSALLKEC